MQRLIFPFASGMIICGYKVAIYQAPPPTGWGYPHYGIDVSSVQGNQRTTDHIVRASGDGEVVWCTTDKPSSGASSLGWAVAVKYKGCLSRHGDVKDLIVRYMHSGECYVKLGDKVKAGDPLLLEGKVGTKDYHVHIEMDTDCKFPQYTPQVSAGHSGWKKGTDSTVNPSFWLWQDSGHKQVPYNYSSKAWINACDEALPFVPAESELSDRVNTLEKENASLKAELAALRERLNQIYVIAKG